MAELLSAQDVMFTPFEPKLKNRFIMQIGGINAYLIKTANRPQIDFDEVILEHMNVTRIQVARTGQHKFHKNMISFPQDTWEFFERMGLLRPFRAGDRVNSIRGPGADDDRDNPNRPPRKVLDASALENQLFAADAAGSWHFQIR